MRSRGGRHAKRNAERGVPSHDSAAGRDDASANRRGRSKSVSGFHAGSGSFLYGNDGLIVLLPNDGTFRPSDVQRGLPGGIKLGWWRIAHGDLTITTRRLDAVSTPLPADVPSGYGDVGFQATGVNFEAAGCWQVVGAVGGQTLTFVVRVAPE